MYADSLICYRSAYDYIALQAYIGLESGNIKTYDLLCRRLSPYAIPNVWELHEKSTSGQFDRDGSSLVVSLSLKA